MRKYIFHKDAFEDFTNWGIVNKNAFKRIAELLKDISRTPFDGKGKPEPLEVLSCKGHYND